MAERRLRALAARDLAVSLFVANGSSGESAKIVADHLGTPNAWAPRAHLGLGAQQDRAAGRRTSGLPVLSNEAGNCPALTRPQRSRLNLASKQFTSKHMPMTGSLKSYCLSMAVFAWISVTELLASKHVLTQT